MYKKLIKELIKIAVTLIVLTILFNVIFGKKVKFPVPDFQFGNYYDSTENCVCHPAAISIKEDGKIYCYSMVGSQIRVFDKNGKFIKKWIINSDGGLVNMFFDSLSQLHIITFRTEKYYKFDRNDSCIDLKSSEFIRHIFPEEIADFAFGPNRKRYTIKNDGIFVKEGDIEALIIPNCKDFDTCR